MLSQGMVWWIAAGVAAEPALDQTAPVHIVHRYDPERVAVYRQQFRVRTVGPFRSTVHAQQEVTVTVPFLPEGGGAQIRTYTRTRAAWSHVEGEPPVLAMPEDQVTTWLVDADGTWRPVQRSGPTDLQQALSGLAPTTGGFVPPAHPIEPGFTWRVPIDLVLEAQSPGEGGVPVTTVLELTGTSEWVFDRWAVIHGTPCAMLREAQSLAGSSRAVPAEGETRVTGVASARSSEVCWDEGEGAVHWQRADSRTVLHDATTGERLRMELHLVSARTQLGPRSRGAPSGSSSTTRTSPR